MTSTRAIAERAFANSTSEKKFYIIGPDADNISADGSILSLDPSIAEGTDTNERIGNRIFTLKTILKMKIAFNPNDTVELFQTYRFIAGIYKSQNLPTVTDILATLTVGTILATNSFYNDQNAGRFHITHDKVYHVYTSPSSQTGYNIWITHPVFKQQSYIGVVAATPQNFRSFLLIISDTILPANAPSFAAVGKTYYTDA